jgi:hypothetical protein
LKEALAKTAAANERSLSSEIEHQLEEYALLRELIPALRRPGILFQTWMFLGAIEDIEKETGKPWPGDEAAIEKVVRRAATDILKTKRWELGRPAMDLVGGNYVLRPGSPISKTTEAAEPDGDDQDQRSTRIFTPGELAVLQRLWDGKGNKLIAHELDMPESTVESHLRHITKKLNARNMLTKASSPTDFFRAKRRGQK